MTDPAEGQGTDEKMENETHKKSEAVCPSKMELAEVRDKLARVKNGPQYWRSLEELAQSDAFIEMLHREFPRQASFLPEGTSRRDFLKLMSASMALAGLSACVKQPLEPIVPYVRQPNEIVLGNPLFFASAMPFGAYGLPALVESHEGRPTKIEGNPEHPAGLGGSDVFMQASILDMYDPDRAQIVTYQGEIRNWSDYVVALQAALNAQKAVQRRGPAHSERAHQLADHGVADGAGAGGVSRSRSGSSGSRSIATTCAPDRCWPSGSTWRRVTTWRRPTSFCRSTATSSPAASRASCITRAQFASRRNPDLKEKMSRFYSVQSTPTNTSGKADHRLPVRASEVETWRAPSLRELARAAARARD